MVVEFSAVLGTSAEIEYNSDSFSPPPGSASIARLHGQR